MSEMIRIDKLLCEMQIGSRREIKEYAKKGRIKVNESVVKNTDLKVNPEVDKVFVDNRKIEFARFEYFMMNKPQGVISATKDEKDMTVVDLIKDNLRGDLFPVGRLDKDTEGLMVITNDGEMAHRILSPAKHISKTYFAKIDGVVTEEDVMKFSKGITLLDGTVTKPASLVILKTDGNTSEIEVKIYEGKYHQIKRMFAACGKHVIYLKRLAMGGLMLDDSLKTGEYRRMTDEELKRLTEETGSIHQ